MKKHTFDNSITGAGGGGCFVGSTPVLTSKGYRPIQSIEVGDSIFCFDETSTSGEITVGKVIKKHIHPKSDNNSGIYKFFVEGIDLPFEVTGNHSILSSDGQWEYAINFEVGDYFVDLIGEKQKIVMIVPRDVGENELVYNLEVEPHHTYIACGIRVHNGGGGGSKGGTPKAAQEAPNTLSSSATAMVVEVISEGEIEGLVDGAKSIYLDGTPVQNSDDSYNFQRFTYTQRKGLPTQDFLRGFPDVESEESVNVEVVKATPVSRQLSSGTDIDAARVTIQLAQGLFKQDKTNGDISGHEVSFAIDTRPTGGVWTEVLAKTISGKSMTPYEESYRIERPDVGPGYWEIRVRRISDDDVDSSLRSAIVWSRITNIWDKKLAYENTAVIGMKVDAKETGGAIPRRSYQVKGLKVQVPVNYNPTTRVYTGSWNGTFKTAWTDNPAWIVYDLMTHDRYGLGTFIEPNLIDKYSFYDVARYNDELVDDGDGGTEPRFTFNAVINTRQEAWKLIQAVASSCRSVVYYGSGLVKLIQDRPTDVSLIVNKSDVVNGMFEYSSTSIQMRHPVVQVSYNNEAEHYNPDTITIENQDGIDKYGYNVKEIVAYGATTQGQARRMGLWAMYTDLGSTESVKFVCGMNLATRITPGSVIKIMDEELQGVPFGGRIVSGTDTTIVLDREVELLSGQTYTIEFVSNDGTTLIEKTITNTPGTYTTVNVSSIGQIPVGGYSWIITSNILTGRKYRIYSVREVGKSQFEVTATTYDEERYALVDEVTNPEYWNPINISLSTCKPPKNVTWNTETLTDSYGRKIVNLRINWDIDNEQYINSYQVSYRKGNGQWTNYIITSQRELVISNVIEDTYEVSIYAINISGVRSRPTLSSFYNVYSSGASPMFPPTNLQVLGGGSTWSGKDLAITWQQNPGNDNLGDRVFKRYKVVISTTGDVPLQTVFTEDNAHTFYFDDNVLANGGVPLRDLVVRVYNQDTRNRFSTDAYLAVSNPVPLAPTFSLGEGYQYYSVEITPPVDTPDIAGYYVAEVVNLGDTPVLGNVVYKGPDRLVQIPSSSSSVNVRVGAYDLFGDAIIDVGWATGQTTNVVQAVATVDSVEGYKFFSLTFKPNDPSINKVSWTTSTVVRTTDSLTKSVPSGDLTWSGSALYVYYDWDLNQILGTTTLATAIGVGKAIIATYYGGTTLNSANGDAYIDGNKVLAQTIGSNQLVTGTAVITESAQIASGIVGGVQLADGSITAQKIQTGAITANEIATGTITSTNLQTGTAVITESAQIASGIVGGVQLSNGSVSADKIAASTITGDKLAATNIITSSAQIGTAVVQSANIGDLQVTTLKIGDHAVTTTDVYSWTTPITVVSNFVDTTAYYFDFVGTGTTFVFNFDVEYYWNDGFYGVVNDGTSIAYSEIFYSIYRTDGGGVVKSYRQAAGSSNAEVYKVNTIFNGQKFMLGLNSYRWRQPFSKRTILDTIAGVPYRVSVGGYKSLSGSQPPTNLQLIIESAVVQIIDLKK